MKTLEIQMAEKESYRERVMKSLRINLILTVILSIVASVASNWMYGVGFGIILFLIQAIKSNRWDRYFISSITVTAADVAIAFEKRGESENIRDNKNSFEFKKKTAISKSRIVYLAVYHNKDLLLEQSEDGQWNEEKFDQVIDAANS